MRLVPVTYRAKRIRGKLAWVNVYALVNVGRAAGATVVAGAAASMLGGGVAHAQGTPCDGGSGTITSPGTSQAWTSGDCTITSSGGVTLNSGSISGSHTALAATATNVGTLSNSGTISANMTTATPSSALVFGFSNVGTVTAILNNAGGVIAGTYAGSMTGSNNKFTITGLGNFTQSGVLGTIGTLVNDGIISATNAGTFAASQLTITSPGVTFRAIDNEGYIGTLINNDSIVGTIGGSFTPGSGFRFPYGIGIENGDLGTIGNLTNGVGALIKASESGIDSRGNIGTLTNNGTIDGGLNGVFLGASGTIGYFLNTGSVVGSLSPSHTTAVGVWNRGVIGTLVNSGLIADQTAVYLAGSGTIGTLTNQGTIMGGQEWALDNAGSIGILNNSGLISTTAVNITVLYNHGQIGTLTNSGTIRGGSTALLNYYGTIGTLSNSGVIASLRNGYGVSNYDGSISVLSNSGSISSANYDGIHNYDAQIGLLDNTSIGTITSGISAAAIHNSASSTIGTLTNEGTISGGTAGINNAGYIGQLTNSGKVAALKTGTHAAITNSGSIGTLTNTGTVTNTLYAGIMNDGGSIGTLSNSGLIHSYHSAVVGTNGGTIQLLENLAGGTILTDNGFAVSNTAGNIIGSISNAGLISALSCGLDNRGRIGAVSNSGTLGGTFTGIYNEGTIGAITNTGSIVGGSSGGVKNNGGSIGTLTNYGVISNSGNPGPLLFNSGTWNAVINEATGTLLGNSVGVLNNTYLGTLTNQGSILSADVGIKNNGLIDLIDNSGVIASSGSQTPAIDNAGTITSLINEAAGTIKTGWTAVNVTGTIGTLTNAGLISSTGGYSGVLVRGGGSIGNLINSGTLSGWSPFGIDGSGAVGTLTNASGGVIVSSGNGGQWAVFNLGTLGSLSNNGTIRLVNPSHTGRAAIYNVGGGVIGVLTNNGTISSNAFGIANEGATLSTLTNSATGTIITTGMTATEIGMTGPVAVPSAAVYNDATGIISSFTNAGLLSGVAAGVTNDGSIGTLSNSGTISAGTGAGVSITGSIGLLVNTGAVLSGTDGIYSSGSIGSIHNAAGATISGATVGLYNAGTLGTLSNAGLINGAADGLMNTGSIDSILNTGTISDDIVAGLGNTGTVASLVNQGVISGNSYGLSNVGSIASLNNSGTIVSTGYTGLRDAGNIATLSNSGLISGVAAGVLVDSGGTLGSLVNSGTITGATALSVGTTGSLGTVTNSGLMAGAINNLSAHDLSFAGGSGSTYGVFTGSSGGLGVADEGTLSSTGANVVFLGGNILLNDNINVGTNTVTNSAVLQVNNSLNITGNYHQTSAGNLVLGVTNATNYGNLTVSGTANIDANGYVSLARLNGFSFAQGQSYTVVLAQAANYNASTLNVAVSGYSGSTTVTQLQRGPEDELVICLGSSQVCSASSGSSGGGSSGGGSSGGGSSGGGSSGGSSSGGGSSGGGSSGGGSSGGGSSGSGSSGGGSSGGGSTGGGSSSGGSSGSTGSGGSSNTSPNHYSMATTPNAVAANNAIVGYTGSNEALINLANQVVSLGSAAAANSAGNQLRADSHGPSSQLALQPAMDVLNVVTAHSDETNLAMRDSPSGVAAGENAAGWAPWSEVLGTTGHQSTEGQFAGYGLATEGILFGADKSITSEIRVGGLGSYTHASLTDHGVLSGDGTGLDNYGLFGYGTYVGARAYFDVSAGVMFDRFNTTRVVNIGDFSGAAYGKHDGLQEIAKVEGGYPFALNSNKTTSFSPLWGLEVMHLHQSAYDETGGSAAALAVGSSTTWSVKSELGGKLEHSVKAAGVTWVPEVRALWRHEFDGSATSQRESFLLDNTGSTDFTTAGPRPEVNTGLLEAGLTVLTHGDVTLAVRYQADIGSGYFDQGGRLRLRWDF